MINVSSLGNTAMNAFVASQIDDTHALARASEPVKTSAPKIIKIELSQPQPADLSAISVKAKKVSANLNTHFGRMGLRLKAVIDTETKKFVIKVIDAATNEVIKQFPEDSFMKVGKKVEDLLQSYGGSKGESLALLEDSMVTR